MALGHTKDSCVQLDGDHHTPSVTACTVARLGILRFKICWCISAGICAGQRLQVVRKKSPVCDNKGEMLLVIYLFSGFANQMCPTNPSNSQFDTVREDAHKCIVYTPLAKPN